MRRNTPIPSAEELIATHEAAHAVACLVVAQRFQSVTIVADDRTGGHLLFDWDAPQVYPQQHAMILLSGSLAGDRLLGARVPIWRETGMYPDWASARGTIGCHLFPAGEPLTVAERAEVQARVALVGEARALQDCMEQLALLCPDQAAAIERALIPLCRCTWRMVNRFRVAIEAVADALLARRVLTYDEAVEVYRSSRPGSSRGGVAEFPRPAVNA